MNSSPKENSIIVCEDNAKGYPVDSFMIPQHYRDYLSSVMIPNGMIHDRLDSMAYDIAQLTTQAPLVMVCVLKGAFQFFSDLLAKVKKHSAALKGQTTFPIIVEYVRIRSYENDRSTLDIKVLGIENLEMIKGKHVLVVEDLVDTGKTLKHLENFLKSYRPETIKFASLMVKRQPFPTFKPEFVGFEIGTTFIVGYGMDYNEYFRDLDHVCVINDLGKSHFAC